MKIFTGVVKDKDNTIAYFLNGQYHREDGPAIEWANGIKKWYLNGKLNREDGPAVEFPNCYKEWYLNGKRHMRDSLHYKGLAVDLRIKDLPRDVQLRYYSALQYALLKLCDVVLETDHIHVEYSPSNY